MKTGRDGRGAEDVSRVFVQGEDGGLGFFEFRVVEDVERDGDGRLPGRDQGPWPDRG
jgi:hypothetical protein